VPPWQNGSIVQIVFIDRKDFSIAGVDFYLDDFFSALTISKEYMRLPFRSQVCLDYRTRNAARAALRASSNDISRARAVLFS